MNDWLILALFLCGLPALDVTALLFGYDSREGFRPGTTRNWSD